MTEKEFEKAIQELREQCFHCNDEEAMNIISKFVENCPNLLNKVTKDWLLKNC